jgi:prolyl-tRNA editing enzyme YbaK/EbsC (Cys-tRNA(Pro) deacylase)
MSFEKVKKYFEQHDMKHKVMEFDSSSETVELAAIAVGCEPKQIAKTMSFIVEGKPITIVMAGDARISNPKYREKFSAKAKMIPFGDVERLIGHDVGGVCPFAVNDGVETYLDISLKRFETVFPAAGSGNSAVELTIEELEKHSNYKEWVDVCKDWE